ncbi:MAG: poly-gamma-glutamate system protein [Lysobacterales bacterium]
MKRLLQLFRQEPDTGTDGQPAPDHARFARFNQLRLLLMAAILAGLWHLGGNAGLNPDENRLWDRVRAAQLHMSQWRQANGTFSTPRSDPWQCGLIGIEWSEITTTLGDLASKRTACDPAWAVQFSRWFHELGLKPGDHIAIYSSGSFPGLLLNAIAAAEMMQLEPLLIVSLGASTWGANHPAIPWPLMASELRSGGFIGKRANFYTLGGGSELGHGMAPEGRALLRKAAAETGVKLLSAVDLQQMIVRKKELLDGFKPGVFINIGGSQANLGDAEEILRLTPGMVPASEADRAGNGVIGEAMRENIPVIHMLNIRLISNRTGIPYDAPPRKTAPVLANTWWSAAGLVFFFIILFTHRRWRLEPGED